MNGKTYHFDENNAWATNGIEKLTNEYLMRPVNIYQPSEWRPYPNVAATPNFWIYVSIKKNRVYLMSGDKVIYQMYSSAGLGNKTPTGTFYVQRERGYSFYVPSQGEGAWYWTSWLHHGEYLFHSVPFNGNHQVIGWEAAKLGK
ncbi:L,D-transpeptidase [[Lactobacillus] timonensis]|uniref:L,D-transpeptidase n=1 Tax=[Lactobacillus] timonensis TaxID=1970790 RepID=UPI00195E3036|nr:L,D-transpeptidase [[Lactobacillus] timonensis]